MYKTLIEPLELMDHIDDPDWIVVDCRFWLKDPARGRREYLRGHIPGAVFADLNQDLSAPVVPGKTSRHPLPAPEEAAAVFSRLGIGNHMQVVAYDNSGGALAAVRLWWMLRWLGHEAAAVLNGGWFAWLQEGGKMQSRVVEREPQEFIPRPRPELLVSAGQVEALRAEPSVRLLDARSADRFRGENETIDPVAGHIPGAICAPYAANLRPDGRFRSVQDLRERYQAILDGRAAEGAVVYCGSGVTSIHNILAMVHAGLGEPRLYAGSWSEWITDGSCPVAVGEA
jgi:thiosulfate/3-mercaptopyruvate sulfurtransferase